jgi:two-component system response regulator AlgR
MSLRVLVVDDEPPARERLKQLLAELPDTELAGEAGSGEEALAVAAEARPDVVLLDIRMPGMGGLEAARHLASLTDPPAVVFTTAYEQHALEAFDAQASGYLLKPIRRERLASALERLRRPTRAQRTVTTEPGKARTHVTARVRDQLKLIPVRDVLCFVAEQKYTTVRHVAGEDLIEDSLRSMPSWRSRRSSRSIASPTGAMPCAFGTAAGRYRSAGGSPPRCSDACVEPGRWPAQGAAGMPPR